MNAIRISCRFVMVIALLSAACLLPEIAPAKFWLGNVLAQNPVIVTVTPNSPAVPSGAQQQFTAQVLNTTNPAVTWHVCPSGTVDQTGLFTAPTVTSNTSICVYAVSVADPSKSGTSYAQVKAPTGPACPTTSIWTLLVPPENDYYRLPAWITTPGPAPLTWVQPADTMYQITEFAVSHFAITAWTVSGNTVTFQSINNLALDDTVTLSGFHSSTFFNNKTMTVSNVPTATEFEVYLPGIVQSTSDAGVASYTFAAAMDDKGIWLGPTNSRADDGTLYCQWLLVQGGTPPFAYSVTGAPPGLAVNKQTGLYSGHATTPGTYSNIVFCATDAKGTQACLKPRSQTICDGGIHACSIN